MLACSLARSLACLLTSLLPCVLASLLVLAYLLTYHSSDSSTATRSAATTRTPITTRRVVSSAERSLPPCSTVRVHRGRETSRPPELCPVHLLYVGGRNGDTCRGRTVYTQARECRRARDALPPVCDTHPGVLAAKVRHFGSNLLKCYSSRSAPNLLKSATWPLAPSNVLKCAPGGGDSQKGSSLHKMVFVPRADQIC